jgi:hypothetical protein
MLNPSHNDGCHRLYKAAVTGRPILPAFVLTAAETLAIRHDAVLGPARSPAGGPRTRPQPDTNTGLHPAARRRESPS